MKVIQIIEYASGNVVKELDITKYGEREVEKIDAGLNINLNHDAFYTRIEEKEDEKKWGG